MRRTRHPSDSKKFFDWLEASAIDLLGARILLENDQCLDISAFLCQQSIEKSFKAYIIRNTGKLVDGHNLTWLCRQAGKHNQMFLTWLKPTATMNRLYIETRYPSDINMDLNGDRVKQIYTIAWEIYDMITHEIYDAETYPSLSSPHFGLNS